jgi:hypothetical protein
MHHVVALTHISSRYAEIFSKISESLICVSSNPGVSTSLTEAPWHWKVGEACTVFVHDSNFAEVSKFEPLTRLINLGAYVRYERNNAKDYMTLTDDFPLPVAPMTLQDTETKISIEQSSAAV